MPIVGISEAQLGGSAHESCLLDGVEDPNALAAELERCEQLGQVRA